MNTFLLTAGASIALVMVALYVLVRRSSNEAQRIAVSWLMHEAARNRQLGGARADLPAGSETTIAPASATAAFDGAPAEFSNNSGESKDRGALASPR